MSVEVSATVTAQFSWMTFLKMYFCYDWKWSDISLYTIALVILDNMLFTNMLSISVDEVSVTLVGLLIRGM